ncbi:SNF-related serine/threonine-protein kinase [Trichoplusia ni]|uniref:SNF-related serine/threonine-protein kinase n=1 Tax=Trichoplusia ni TaxID=7111 RepID=A0A7E5WDS9_TRINI|nr:SNF-related serine/threonine-protein kinase [Trichoplusia ni]
MNNNCAGVGAGAVGGGGGAYDAKIAGLYDLLDTLGSGHFAVVKLARHVFTGEKVAVKVIDKSKLDEVSKSHLFQEVRCMKLVQHPNVVRLYEVIDTQTKLYLILELGDGGDLYDYIMRHESGLSESLARDYFRQIVRAISYCHRLHVVHRDLKPENVVFFQKFGVVKLTDFGFSNKFCPGQKLETSCGSLAYSAPEILLGDSYDAPAVDVWSLGVILYMLVCGQAPFQEANDSETLTMIMDCKYTIPQHISNSCKRLIGRMLVREPEKRATLSEIATDPWVTAGEGVTVEDFDTPLVAKEQLSEDDRTAIIQRMVNGSIASKEQILEALEKNEYNHITATYYLLAERKLRSKRQEARRRPEALGVGRAAAAPAPAPAPRSLLAPPSLSAAPRTPQDVPPKVISLLLVPCQCIDLNYIHSGLGSAVSSAKRKMMKRVRSPADAARALLTRGAARGPRAACTWPRAPLTRHTRRPPRTRPLRRARRCSPTTSPRSAHGRELRRPRPTPGRCDRPNSTLSQVNLDDEGSADTKARGAPPPAPPPARRQRLECRRRRARAGSCSSSDLSDDDSEKKKRAAEHADGPPERARRDSHDDSSDSQERGGGAGALGGRGGGARTAAPAPAPAERGAGGAAGDGRAGGPAGAAGGRRRRAARKESRLRESRSLNRIAEVEEASGGARWGGGGLVALCGRPLLRLLAAARPPPATRRLHGLC